MGRKYDELKNIRNLYDTAFDNYNNDTFIRRKNNLKKYLKQLNLNTTPGAELFIEEFKTEIPTLNKLAKRNLSVLANKTLQQLQSSEIIDLRDIPDVPGTLNDVAWPTALLETINKMIDRKTIMSSPTKKKMSSPTKKRMSSPTKKRMSSHKNN